MDAAEFLSKQIMEATILQTPWPHIKLNPALPDDVYERLMERVGSPVTQQHQGRMYEPLVAGDEFYDLVASPLVKDALREKLGFAGKPYPRLIKDYRKAFQRVHPDALNKVGTLQIYMTRELVEGHGTKLWDKGATHVVEEVPFAPNVGYAFKRQDYTWHSMGPFYSDRWSLLCPYKTN